MTTIKMLPKDVNGTFLLIEKKIILLMCYLRSPDGSCIITNSEDKTLRVFDLNEQMINSDEKNINELVSLINFNFLKLKIFNH